MYLDLDLFLWYFHLNMHSFHNGNLSLIYMENSSINNPGFFFIWLVNSELAMYLGFSATIFTITA